MNIASALVQIAKDFPEKTALTTAQYSLLKKKHSYQSITFREFDQNSNKFAHRLLKLGLTKGDRTLIFLKPNLNFAPVVFALFKIGVIPVFIDPGMGKKNLLNAIAEVKPKAMIAEEAALYLRYFFPSSFNKVKINIGAKTLNKWTREEKNTYFQIGEFLPSEEAAILYTSGGTGAPKGVIYTHEIFSYQVKVLKEIFTLTSEDLDMPGFPLFSLFTIMMGMTSSIPDMNPSRPGESNPERLYKNIIDQQPTFVAGSPAIWDKLADYCLEHQLTLPSIKYLVMFGAPVSVVIHQKFKAVLTNGTTYTPYGATECLPVSNISGKYILEATAKLTNEGNGTCIGLPVIGNNVKIIKCTDQVISNFSEIEELAPNEVGEIIVKGPTVTKEYFNHPEKTKEAKIYDSETIWHRMGDLGYIDPKGHIWFMGRKAHRVETSVTTLYPISTEAIFNKHPAIKRSALVGLGNIGSQIPAIVIERKDQQYLQGKDRSVFESELLSIAKNYPHTKGIDRFYYSKKFPVDVRHNIKIDRKKLKLEIEEYEKI